MFRVILYSLKPDTKTGKTTISYDLNGCIVENNLTQAILKLDNKLYTIEKSKWVNTMKVFDTGSKFFVICTKSINTDYAFEILMKYAMQKIDTRIDFLQTIKLSYQKELNSLKLKAA